MCSLQVKWFLKSVLKMKHNKFHFFLIDFSYHWFKDKEMFRNVYDFLCLKIYQYFWLWTYFCLWRHYSQNVVLKTFLIWNDTRGTRQHLVAKSELFGRLWYDPAISKDFFRNLLLKICNYLAFQATVVFTMIRKKIISWIFKIWFIIKIWF